VGKTPLPGLETVEAEEEATKREGPTKLSKGRPTRREGPISFLVTNLGQGKENRRNGSWWETKDQGKRNGDRARVN